MESSVGTVLLRPLKIPWLIEFIYSIPKGDPTVKIVSPTFDSALSPIVVTAIAASFGTCNTAISEYSS